VGGRVKSSAITWVPRVSCTGEVGTTTIEMEGRGRGTQVMTRKSLEEQGRLENSKSQFQPLPRNEGIIADGQAVNRNPQGASMGQKQKSKEKGLALIRDRARLKK